MRLRASPLLAIGPARPGPAIRRGFLVAVPVGVALLLEFGLDSPTKGALATGAMFAGFPALDAPAKVRAAWQAVVAPLVGAGAALGIVTGVSPVLAIPTLAVVGALAGYCFSVSLRLSIAGLSVALSVLVSQGLPLDAGDALPAFLLATAGGLMQPVFSILVWAAGDRDEEGGGKGWSTRAAIADLRANWTLQSESARHALRFGAALGAGVATYWILGMEDHGYWIPLTILFVLRPSEDETDHRLILRAVGTLAGLVVASLLSEWFQDDPIALALVLTLATGFAYGLLTVQYALFTTAITVYAVVLADTLGEPELEAAGQRAAATAIGIAIAFLAFRLWSNREKLSQQPMP